MTFVAFAPYADKAEVLTDTTSYGRTLRTMGHKSKVHALPHLDCVFLTQGQSQFGAWVGHFLAQLDEVPTFADLTEQAAELAADAWRFVNRQADDLELGRPVPSALFLLGPIRDRFRAFGYSSHNEFERTEHEGLTVMPVPLDPPMRISDHEAGTLAEGPCHPNDLAELRRRPPGTVPRNLDEWVALGVAARESRAMLPPHSGLKTLVAGSLLHTRVKRGLVTTRTAHEFDDEGQEFFELVAGTLHPQAQLGPCLCGSGRRAVDCHMPATFDEPCPCESGRTLRDCCLVPLG